MDVRRVVGTVLAGVAALGAAGCRKSPPPAPMVVAPEDVSHLHWVGSKRLAAATNPTPLQRVLTLPETGRLHARTLDKLALAAWRWQRGDAATNDAPVALLREVLDDLLREECWLEIRHATNQPAALALAVRLDEARATRWDTNLAAVCASLSGWAPRRAAPGRSGWVLQPTNAPQRLELRRVGDWTLLGWARANSPLLDDMAERIRRDGAPFASPATNSWVEADLDLRRTAMLLWPGRPLPDQTPRLRLTLVGEGEDVQTRAQLDFARPLPCELEAWNIPTNLINEPLASFAAVRGFRPWLAAWRGWEALGAGPPPNQVFGWGQAQGLPHTYWAAPWPAASNQLDRLAVRWLPVVNAWAASNQCLGRLERAPQFSQVSWGGVPFLFPHLRTVVTNEGDFLLGGFFPAVFSPRPPPPELLDMVLSRTNLVAYEWELTGARVEAWTFIGQAARLILQRPQMPAAAAAPAWLRAVQRQLGNTVTAVTLTGPAQLTVTRRSTAGLSAWELHLLVDWLESPQFPRGFFSTLATAETVQAAALQEESDTPPPRSPDARSGQAGPSRPN